MMTSSRHAYVWTWLPKQTSPVVAGRIERDDQDRYQRGQKYPIRQAGGVSLWSDWSGGRGLATGE